MILLAVLLQAAALAGPTAVAFIITFVAALVGGLAAKRLSDAL